MIRSRPTCALLFAFCIPLLSIGCASEAQRKALPSEVVVTSWLDVDFAALNAQIRKAQETNAPWVSIPQLYAFNLFDFAETKEIDYHFSADRIEAATAVEVTIRRDGFADDAVRGDIHALKLRRDNQGAWRIVSLKRATRCWRPEAAEYSAAACR